MRGGSEIEPVFLSGDADYGSDRLEAYCRGGRMTVEIESPWMGDSETGFGRSCSIGLSLDGAESLARWMLATVECARRTGEPVEN